MALVTPPSVALEEHREYEDLLASLNEALGGVPADEDGPRLLDHSLRKHKHKLLCPLDRMARANKVNDAKVHEGIKNDSEGVEIMRRLGEELDISAEEAQKLLASARAASPVPDRDKVISLARGMFFYPRKVLLLCQERILRVDEYEEKSDAIQVIRDFRDELLSSNIAGKIKDYIKELCDAGKNAIVGYCGKEGAMLANNFFHLHASRAAGAVEGKAWNERWQTTTDALLACTCAMVAESPEQGGVNGAGRSSTGAFAAAAQLAQRGVGSSNAMSSSGLRHSSQPLRTTNTKSKLPSSALFQMSASLLIAFVDMVREALVTHCRELPPKLDALLASDACGHEGFKSVICLAVATWLQQVSLEVQSDDLTRKMKAFWKLALSEKNDAFQFMNDLVTSELFVLDGEGLLLFSRVLGEFMVHFLHNFLRARNRKSLSEIEEMRKREETSHQYYTKWAQHDADRHRRPAYGAGSQKHSMPIAQPKKHPPHFQSLVLLVACLFEVNAEFEAVFYDEENAASSVVSAFFLLAGQISSRTSPFFVPFLYLMASRATHADGARVMFDHLCSNQSNSSGVSSIFGCIADLEELVQIVHAEGASHFGGATGSRFAAQQRSAGQEHTELQHSKRVEAWALLIGRIAYYNIEAAVAIKDRLLMNLFNILRLPVLPSLKAAILIALSAFAAAPGLAQSDIIPMLEHGQILQTIDPSPDKQDILYELKNAETPARMYALTLSFVSLLHQILMNVDGGTGSDAIRRLGREVRTRKDFQGFHPYLDFVRDHVFLKLSDRSYDITDQKWELAEVSLGVMHLILLEEQYVDWTTETPSANQASLRQSMVSVRDQLLLDFLKEPSELLRKVLGVVATVAEDLLQEDEESLVSQARNYPRERALLMALRIIRRLLEIDVDHVFQNSPHYGRVCALKSSIFSGQMSKANGQHVLNIAVLITYPFNPAVCIESVCILLLLPHTRVVQILSTQNKHVAEYVLQGYAAKLREVPSEAADLLPYTAPANSVQPSPWAVLDPNHHGASYLPTHVREAIVELLLRNLKSTQPNLSHFLLGFNTCRSPPSSTSLRRLADPSRCLHVLLELMSGRNFTDAFPRLAEMCHHLVHDLAFESSTSGVFLRFLRRSQPWQRFLQTHLTAICRPLETLESAENVELLRLPLSHFRRPGGVLSGSAAAALGALSLSSGNGRTEDEEEYNRMELLAYRAEVSRRTALLLTQRSWLLRTIALELHVSARAEFQARDELLTYLFRPPSQSSPDDEFSGYTGSRFSGSVQRRNIMILFDAVNVPDGHVPTIPIGSFPSLKLEEFSEDHNRHLINMPRLHHYLMLQQSINRNVRPEDIEELETALVERNRLVQLFTAKSAFLDAWQRVVSVSVCELHSQVRDLYASGGGHFALPYELLEILLQNIAEPTVHIQLAQPMAVVSLRIVAKLRQEERRRQNSTGSMLHHLPVDELQSVLTLLLRALFRPSSTPDLRCDLYASLINYLHLCSYTRAHEGYGATRTGAYSQMEESALAVRRDLLARNTAQLSAHGEKLLALLCEDVNNSRDTLKCVAFATLDTLVDHEEPYQHYWLRLLNQRGFIKQQVNQLRVDDTTLLELLRCGESSAKVLNPIFIFEGRMSLLLHLAHTHRGARCLFECGILDRLHEMRVIDHRPDPPTAHDTALGPSHAMSRYYQIALPLWELAAAIAASLKSSSGLASQLLHFIATHKRLVSRILKNRDYAITLDSLRELRWTTAVFSRLSKHIPEMDKVLGGKSSKYISFMLALLVKFANTTRFLPHLQPTSAYEAGKESTPMPSVLDFSEANKLEHEARTLASHVLANTASFVRAVMQVRASDASAPPLFSAPEENDHVLRPSGSSRNGADYARHPISEIFAILERENGLLFQLQKAGRHRNSLLLQNPAELSSEHKKELVAFLGDEDANPKEYSEFAVEELLRSKSQECVIHYYTLEQCLMILWLYTKKVSLQSLLRGAKRLNNVLDQVLDNPEVRGMAQDRFVEQVIGKMKDRLHSLLSNPGFS
eukprot:TRINITY_DN9042_c0_g1_i1.p1 TRINITY_DN9042_c0_g1~~TRINITY_DN9042_c0_g1_i1.p1  ORF type:complete len:2019 (-),score=517.48 TRINITY_DN9042_c0_g1_i1:306-6362(-)